VTTDAPPASRCPLMKKKAEQSREAYAPSEFYDFYALTQKTQQSLMTDFIFIKILFDLYKIYLGIVS
jgi:hypothetical protein